MNVQLASASTQIVSIPRESHDAYVTEQPVHAFASSVLSNVGVGKLITPSYDLEESIAAVLLRRYVNDTYLLTGTGSKFVLKIYRVNLRSKKAIAEELRAIGHLRSKGVRVAEPIPRRDGDLITELDVPEGVRYAVIFRWVNGQEPGCSDAAHLISAGRTLAELHLASDDLSLGRARPRIDFTHLFDHPLAVIRPTLENFPDLSERFERAVEKAMIFVGCANNEIADWGFCHGDFDPTNMCIDGDGVCAFDFDWCGMGWRTYDLATYTLTCLRRGVSEAMVQPLIDGYLQVRPTAADSMRFVPLFTLLRQIWLMEQWVFLASCEGAYVLSRKTWEDTVDVCERTVRRLETII